MTAFFLSHLYYCMCRIMSVRYSSKAIFLQDSYVVYTNYSTTTLPSRQRILAETFDSSVKDLEAACSCWERGVMAWMVEIFWIFLSSLGCGPGSESQISCDFSMFSRL